MFDRAFLIAALFALMSTGAWAAEVPSALQALLLQHAYGAVATDSDEGSNNQIVTAWIEGKKVRLLIDCGAPCSVITSKTAQRLRLNVIQTTLLGSGVGGVFGHLGIALIHSFQVDHCEITRLNKILVVPRTAKLDVDGLLGWDLLYLNSVILPVGGHGLLIKPGPTPPVPIALYMHQMNFSAVPFKNDAFGHLVVDGTLNGKNLHVMIDSGAAFSTFQLQYVKTVTGKDPREIENMFMTGVDGIRNETYHFTPKELTLASFRTHPMMVVSNDLPWFAKTGVNGCIGYDILAIHHAVLDFRYHLLWLR